MNLPQIRGNIQKTIIKTSNFDVYLQICNYFSKVFALCILIRVNY